MAASLLGIAFPCQLHISTLFLERLSVKVLWYHNPQQKINKENTFL